MNVGVSTVDITPPVGSELSGYLYRVQPSIGVRDPLFAKSLYLVNGRVRRLWVHTDLIGLDGGFVAEMKTLLARRYALSPGRIILTATHTHAGPATVRLTLCGEYDKTYLVGLKKRLIECAGRAMERTEAARSVFAEGTCDLAVDRRGSALPHVDHRVGVMAWQRADGSYVAALANYPMHNVGFPAENRRISGDIAGVAASAVGRALPGAPVVLMTNGACGNINPPRHVDDDEQLRVFSEALAGSVSAALTDSARPLPVETMASVSEIIRIPIQVFRPDEVERCADCLRRSLVGQTGYGPDRYRRAIDHWKKSMLPRARKGTLPDSADLALQVIRIGDVYFVCLGAEVFSRMADDLRAATRKRVYVVGYANGCVGYLPTPEAFAEKGYETGSAFVFYGSLPPRPEAFTQVRDRAAALVRRLSVANDGA